MANLDHVNRLKDAINNNNIQENWNLWRGRNPNIKPDLSQTDLRGVNLKGIDLNGSDLRGADFSPLLTGEIMLTWRRNATQHDQNTSLILANLIDADLRGANLSQVNFTGANLSKAKLTHANLHETIFHSTKLDETDFSEASFSYTTLLSLDLSNVVGLETMDYMTPSYIGIDTLTKSNGKIPEPFLWNCYVPFPMILYARSLAGRAKSYYSSFISYSTKDEEFCQILHASMKVNGLTVWFAPENMKGGKKIHEQITSEIHKHDKLILVLSHASMNSPWVKLEIQRARNREKEESRRILFPIRLVSFDQLKNWELITSDGEDLAEEIRQYYIPDFTQWNNNDTFRKEFLMLLNSLEQSEI